MICLQEFKIFFRCTHGQTDGRTDRRGSRNSYLDLTNHLPTSICLRKYWMAPYPIFKVHYRPLYIDCWSKQYGIFILTPKAVNLGLKNTYEIILYIHTICIKTFTYYKRNWLVDKLISHPKLDRCLRGWTLPQVFYFIFYVNSSYVSTTKV